jgi:hypothetical protein
MPNAETIDRTLNDTLACARAAVAVCCSPSRLIWHLATHRHHGPGRAGRSRVRQADGRRGGQGKSAMPGPARWARQALGAPVRSVLRQRAPTTRASASSSPIRSAACCSASAGRAGRDPARLPDRHVAADVPGARSVHPGAEADLAARLDAAGALHDQGFRMSAIFVIFICSLWPMLINTAFGVASGARNGSTSRARWSRPLRTAFR